MQRCHIAQLADGRISEAKLATIAHHLGPFPAVRILMQHDGNLRLRARRKNWTPIQSLLSGSPGYEMHLRAW